MSLPHKTRVPPTRQPRSGPVRFSRFGALITAALAGIYAGHLLAALPGMIAEARACPTANQEVLTCVH